MIERRTAETTPTAIESSFPNGLPIAATGSPAADLGRVAERNGREHVSVRRHAQEGDVVVDVPADDLGLGPVSVLEPDEDPARLGRLGRPSPASVIT